MDTTQLGAEYINANYIRQPSEADQCDMNSSSTENLSTSLCAACTFAQQQKNCQNCQLLNKTCVQCAMKSAIIPLNGNCTNCGKKTEVSFRNRRTSQCIRFNKLNQVFHFVGFGIGNNTTHIFLFLIYNAMQKFLTYKD